MTSIVDFALAETLRTADSIVVLTGAGVSAESGVPTFRDALTGLWSKFHAEDLATPQAFSRDPELVTRWYDDRRCNVAKCRPNAGHNAIAQLQFAVAREGRQFTLITQNVDRLHQLSGSSNVIELHGSLWVWRCVECSTETLEHGPAFNDYPPRCPCGGLKRPGVVWFGESLPPAAVGQAQNASAGATLFMSIGTSGVVHPAAGLIDIARHHGARIVEINPHATPMSESVDWAIREKSGIFLPALVSATFS